jgi:prepilin-type N-terminal cleavage/methylation domain-containing protein
MNRRPQHRGFTLLELVLVMVVVCTALAMAAPSLSGWSRGAKLRDAADQFFAVTRYARAESASSCQVHRLYVDPSAGRYWLAAQDGQQFVELSTGLGRAVVVPDGFRINLTDAQSKTLEFVEFYPTGRTTPAHFSITADNGETINYECPSPAEGFRLTNGHERTR